MASGQTQRVHYTLRAARAHFHVTLLHVAPAGEHASLRAKLAAVADDVILLPARYQPRRLAGVPLKLRARWHSLA
jgi:hypothetical protein